MTRAGDLTITRQPATGLITGTTLADVSESRTLNGFGEVSARTVTRGGSTLDSASYTRDALAHIESMTETVAGTTHLEAYTYDPAGRLETVTSDGVLAASYGYDANGNLVQPRRRAAGRSQRPTTHRTGSGSGATRPIPTRQPASC